MNRYLVIIVMISIFNLFSTFSLSAETAELEDMWQAIQESSFIFLDFKVRVTNKQGEELSDLVVDEIVSFQITAQEVSDKTYTLLYAEDNQPIRLYEDITLPFILKQNFKGRREGNYTITFGLKDAQGNIGKLSLTLTVTHKD